MHWIVAWGAVGTNDHTNEMDTERAQYPMFNIYRISGNINVISDDRGGGCVNLHAGSRQDLDV